MHKIVITIPTLVPDPLYKHQLTSAEDGIVAPVKLTVKARPAKKKKKDPQPPLVNALSTQTQLAKLSNKLNVRPASSSTNASWKHLSQ